MLASCGGGGARRVVVAHGLLCLRAAQSLEPMTGMKNTQICALPLALCLPFPKQKKTTISGMRHFKALHLKKKIGEPDPSRAQPTVCRTVIS